MDNLSYGVATANKFTLVDLDADDPLDYLNVIGEQSIKDKLKLKDQEQQKAKGKGGKQNKSKKNVQPEKNIVKQETVIQKKEGNNLCYMQHLLRKLGVVMGQCPCFSHGYLRMSCEGMF